MSGVLILTPLSIAVWKKGESQYRSRGRLLALRVGLKTYAPLVAGGWDVVINVVKDVRVCSCSHPFPDAVNGKALLFSTFLLHLLTLHRWPARANGKWQYHPPRTCHTILFFVNTAKRLVSFVSKPCLQECRAHSIFEWLLKQQMAKLTSSERPRAVIRDLMNPDTKAQYIFLSMQRAVITKIQREKNPDHCHIDVRLSTVDEVYLYKIVL